MVTFPTATPVTIPLLFTVATEALELAKVISLPVSTFPSESLTTTVKVCVVPGNTVKLPGVTVTVETATGAATEVPTEVPVTDSQVAVMVTLPTPTNVTTPAALTDATAPLLVFHVIVLPESTLLSTSIGRA